MPAFREVHVVDGANDPHSVQPYPSRESAPIGRQCRSVLVLLDLTTRGEAVLQYATGIAVKGRSTMLAVHVIDKRPWLGSDGPCGHFLPEEQQFFTARAAAKKLDLLLAKNNASWAESTVLYGKTEEALAALIRRRKPDLIVVDAKAARDRAVAGALASAQESTRVLALERAHRGGNGGAGNRDLRGGEQPEVGLSESVMRTAQNSARSRQVARTLLLGVATGVLYWLMFANEGMIVELTAKGHWYFILPLTIAFVFSAVHGAFTAEFWDTLGFKAKRRR